MAEINISFDISGLHTYRVSFIVSGCPWVQNMILPGRVLSNINTAYTGCPKKNALLAHVTGQAKRAFFLGHPVYFQLLLLLCYK